MSKELRLDNQVGLCYYGYITAYNDDAQQFLLQYTGVAQ